MPVAHATRSSRRLDPRPDPNGRSDAGRTARELLAAMPRHRDPASVAERRLFDALARRPRLRAAMFRLVDVRPACRDDLDLTRHLADLLDGVGSTTARRAAAVARRPLVRRGVARAASAGVRRMARRFIVGESPESALPAVALLWRSGIATSVDLLGEATVTENEADGYAERCVRALEVLQGAAASWPANPLLDADGLGALPRVNLSVKVSALTSEVRPHAPERGAARGAERFRRVLRVARDVGAHVHVDAESLDSRDTVLGIALGVLGEPEFADGPSAGVVVQAYLRESPEHVAGMLDWLERHPRSTPLTIRLVKGAYWDHEVAEADRHGWEVPVFTERRACDRNFEHLTRVLVDAFPALRLAVASHNLRSIAHASAYADAAGLAAGDIELQVLRGLGDDAAGALRRLGRRVRAYCPVGDLEMGMAYLVRRLLENTSNDSFLRSYAQGVDPSTLLEAP